MGATLPPPTVQDSVDPGFPHCRLDEPFGDETKEVYERERPRVGDHAGDLPGNCTQRNSRQHAQQRQYETETFELHVFLPSSLIVRIIIVFHDNSIASRCPLWATHTSLVLAAIHPESPSIPYISKQYKASFVTNCQQQFCVSP